MFYASNKTVKLAVYDWNAVTKNTIVLVPGWPFPHEIFEYQIDLLLRCGYRVVTFDPRGFGHSDAPASGYGYNQAADDILTVVRQCRLQQFILAGFSTGGAAAVRYMARHSGWGVKKLVLLAAPVPCLTQRPDFPYGISQEQAEERIELAMSDRPALCSRICESLFVSPPSREMINWFLRLAWNASGVATLQTTCAMRDEDCRGDMEKIQVPTGIFHGRQDSLIPFELAELLHEAVPSSLLFSFESSGHAVFLEERNVFQEQFVDFLLS